LEYGFSGFAFGPGMGKAVASVLKVIARMRRLTLATLALLALSACTTPRPPSQVCRGFGLTGDTAVPAALTETGPIAAEVERLLTLRAPTARGPIVVNYLVMSTGGQYGAFGSGFLRGWGENAADPRPVFDIVTGASAGGVIAPFALAGQGFDESLTLNAGIGTADVLRQRNPLEMLTATSIMDISGFESRIRTAITPALVAQLAQDHAQGRSAFVGTVNLDTSGFEVVDLARIAAEDPRAEPCIEEAILATSAIPGLFPPRNINDHLYVDAGLRDHVFFAGVRQAIGRAKARGIQVQLNAFIIINGDLRAPVTPVEHNLRALALRSMSIVTDQGLRKSVLEVLRLGEETQWNIRAITAREVDLSSCGGVTTAVESKEEALFDACTTQALFNAGRAYGQSAHIPWLTAGELRAMANAP
jgi:predicted acylesterase/phospholipase RssA